MTEDEILEFLTHYFDEVEAFKYVGGFKNHVYSFIGSGGAYILRLTPPEHRYHLEIEQEVEWIRYLHNHGVNLSMPVQSVNGNDVETFIWNQKPYTAVVFAMALGEKMTYPEYLGNEAVFEALGKITGKMHKVTQSFQPQLGKRFEHLDQRYLEGLNKKIPSNQPYLKEALDKLVYEIEQLDKERDGFGLIHGDINIGNFHRHQYGITLFDFDECHYSWYVEDIAIQLYYTVYVMLDDNIPDRMRMANTFMHAFMKGYLQEHALDLKWLKCIPLFLKLRELIVQIGLYHSWDFTQLGSWQSNYYEQSKVRIMSGQAIVNDHNAWYVNV